MTIVFGCASISWHKMQLTVFQTPIEIEIYRKDGGKRECSIESKEVSRFTFAIIKAKESWNLFLVDTPLNTRNQGLEFIH